MDGEQYLDGCSLSADELRALGRVTWRRKGADELSLVFHDVRATHDRLLVRFAGVHSREDAAQLVNGELWVDSEKLPDPGPGVAYTYQFVGLKLVATDGRALGTVREIVEVGDRLFCAAGSSKTLLPIHTPYLKHVDLDGGTMTIELPAGFEELL